MFFIALLGTLAAFAAAAGDGVVPLTPDNFDTVVDGSLPAFVEFYAPWCGHCKALEPEYNIVGETYSKSDGVIVAKVDADAHRELAQRFGVSGFPTLKWFPQGSTTPEDYNSGRSAEEIVNFINSKTGLKKRVKTVPSDVVALTPATFDSIVMDPKKSVLVEFYAPWCGHCKQLAPTYEKLGTTYAGEENIVIAKMDADKYGEFASKFGVTGFPTLKWFGRGDDKTPVPYDGGRDGDSLVSFVNSNTGAQRRLGGELSEQAGRIASLDEIASRFLDGDQKALLAEAEAAVAGLSADQAKSGKLYVHAMKKIMEKGSDYPASEIQRLENMLESGSVSAAKKTLFMTRRNILKSFGAEGAADEL